MPDFKTLSTLLCAALASAGALAAQAPGELFPEPFLVEHLLVQTDPNGDVFTGEPVTDYYGGSWIVSERADGSRMVIDLARRELTEIRPAEGVYYSLSFGRFAELRGEIARFEAGFPQRGTNEKGPSEEETKAGLAEKPEQPSFEITESPGGALKARTAGLPDSAAAFLTNPGVRHIRVGLKSDGLGLESTEGESMDVWCDESVRLTPNALTALEGFELDVLGPPRWLAAKRVAPARFLAAARRQAAGAFPVRTVRPIDLGLPEAEKAGGPTRGTVEDVAIRLEKLDRFPLELVSIADGLRRTAHPMEAIAAFAEREEERERIMGQSISDE